MPTCREQLVEAFGAKEQTNCFDDKTVAQEGEGKFTIIHKSKPRKTICRVHIDNCLIKGTKVKRCDYLFKVCETEHYLLIEFKGSDIKSAFPQIINTLNYLKKKLSIKANQCEGIVVASRYVPAADQKIRKLQAECLKNHKLSIQIKNQRASLAV